MVETTSEFLLFLLRVFSWSNASLQFLFLYATHCLHTTHQQWLLLWVKPFRCPFSPYHLAFGSTYIHNFGCSNDPRDLMFVALSLTDLSITQVSLLCCDLSIFHIDYFVPFFQKRNSSHLLSSFIWSLKYRWTGGLTKIWVPTRFLAFVSLFWFKNCWVYLLTDWRIRICWYMYLTMSTGFWPLADSAWPESTVH